MDNDVICNRCKKTTTKIFPIYIYDQFDCVCIECICETGWIVTGMMDLDKNRFPCGDCGEYRNILHLIGREIKINSGLFETLYVCSLCIKPTYSFRTPGIIKLQLS